MHDLVVLFNAGKTGSGRSELGGLRALRAVARPFVCVHATVSSQKKRALVKT